jgi:molecular chaperone GrpE
MSEKKKIKINVESENTEERKNTEIDGVENEESQRVNAEQDENVAVQDPLKELEAKLKAKEEEAKETYDRLLRTSADFENFKKRTAREMEEFRKYANQSLLKEMLSVVDNLELAINSSNGNKSIDKNLVDGLHLTLSEILRVFEKFDVKPIEAKGKSFDPNFHEAVMREETDEYSENTIISEFQKGYMIHDRLLRPAMVVVAAPKTGKDEKSPTKRDKK